MKHLLLLLLSALTLAACGNNEEKSRALAGGDADSLEAQFRTIMGIMIEGDLNDLDNYVAADVVDHQMMPAYRQGLKGLKKMMGDMRIAYPDVKLTIEHVAVDGDHVIARYRWRGTNTGELMGVKPTNKAVDVQGVDWMRIENGKMVEHWGFSEELKMMNQLGLLPRKGGDSPVAQNESEAKIPAGS